jgi:hypothetical protein
MRAVPCEKSSKIEKIGVEICSIPIFSGGIGRVAENPSPL